MKLIILAAAAIATSSIPLFQTSLAQETKPNFIITIADDHGVYHSSVYGSPEFKTPHLETLAKDGIRFDRAYVASPACAPSRAALFTGFMPYRNGIVGNHETELKPGVQSLIPPLLDQGYDVVFIGKVGHGPVAMHRPYVPEAVTNLGRGRTSGQEAVEKIEDLLRQRDPSRPLALFIGWTDTHTPWPKKEEARIPHEQVVIPPRIYDTPEARQEMARYIEAAEDIDRKFGQTRALINRYLDPQNTLVAYTSDHGMPWPFGKWSLYEAGIRTPFIVAWPGRIKPDTQTQAMISWIDIVPTLIDLASGTVPDDIDGESFAAVLFGETDQHRDRVFATHKGDKSHNVYPIRSVHLGDWKYILNLNPNFKYTTHTDLYGKDHPHGGHHWHSYVKAAESDPRTAAFLMDYHSNPAEELYNLADDPHETKNRAADPAYSSHLQSLRQLVAQRMIDVQDDRSLSGEPRILGVQSAVDN